MSKIEWTGETWNPIVGCSLQSPGCKNCYAMGMAHRLEAMAGAGAKGLDHYRGLTEKSRAGQILWTGKIGIAPDDVLIKPLRWKKPRKIFVNSMSDLFHPDVPDDVIDRVFAVMALCPQHIFQVLTKRADRMRVYYSDPNTPRRVARQQIDWLIDHKIAWRESWPVQSVGDPDDPDDLTINWPLPNVWLGVSVEDQTRADERIPDLLATPAAVRWLSCEPLLGLVDLNRVTPAPSRFGDLPQIYDALHGDFRDHGHGYRTGKPCGKLDWIVCGGESGKGSRPMHPDWARDLRDQCADAGVPFFFKQWGQWAPVCEMTEEALDGCYHPAPPTHPEATRRLKVQQCVLHADGARFDGRAMFERPAFEQGSRAMTMMAIGKAKAGRLLDGQLHDAMPEPAQ